MRTTLIGRWLEKNQKSFVALLAAGATLAMATLIDASSSSQVEQLGQMAIHRSAHRATALSDGRVLITGGRNSAGIVIADAEIFDPNTAESTAVASMGTARVDHTATLLKDGRVLIAGGRNLQPEHFNFQCGKRQYEHGPRASHGNAAQLGESGDCGRRRHFDPG
jgi:Galactose oxidase, central domain